MIRCCSLQYCAIGLAELQQRIQQQGSIPRLNHKDQYMPVRTSLYDLNYSRTALYLHVPPYTIVCTTLYHLVPSCTTLYYLVLCTAGTRQSRYMPVTVHHDTSMYCHRNCLCWYVLVCTISSFEVSRTALYRVRYVLARTSTYHLVLPCTRCTGFQMV